MPLQWYTHDGRRRPSRLTSSTAVYIDLRSDAEPHHFKAILRGAKLASDYSWQWSDTSRPSPNSITAYAIATAERPWSPGPWLPHDPANGYPFGPTIPLVQIKSRNTAALVDAREPTLNSFLRANNYDWTADVSPGSRISAYRFLIPEGAPMPKTPPPPTRPRLTDEQRALIGTLPQWARSQYSRLCLGRHKPAPWHAEPWAQHSPTDPRFLHFLHHSEKQTGLLAYTPSAPRDDAKPIRVPIKAGRYLQRFYAADLTPEQIKSWAAKVRGRAMTLHTTTNATEILHLYQRVGQACMSHTAGHYKSAHLNGGHHPTAAYADSPDLALAYILEEGETDPARARARAVIWPARKLHTRAYGDTEAMLETLAASGYRPGLLDGARLRILPITGDRAYLNCLTAPYIDHIKWALYNPAAKTLTLQDRATGATHSVQHGDGFAYPIHEAPKRPIHVTSETIAREHARLVALEAAPADSPPTIPSPPPCITANIPNGQPREGGPITTFAGRTRSRLPTASPLRVTIESYFNQAAPPLPAPTQQPQIAPSGIQWNYQPATPQETDRLIAYSEHMERLLTAERMLAQQAPSLPVSELPPILPDPSTT